MKRKKNNDVVKFSINFNSYNLQEEYDSCIVILTSKNIRCLDYILQESQDKQKSIYMVEEFIFLFLFIILFFFIKNIKWGVCLFLVFMILVPVSQFRLGSFKVGYNFFAFIVLFCYIIYVGRINHKTDIRPLYPFLVYYGLTLVIMPFQSGVPLDFMLNIWRIDIMRNLILPIVMWNIMLTDESCVILFRNAFLLSIGIAVSYALLLTQFGGVNPYLLSLSGLLGSSNIDYSAYYVAEDGGRIFGRISSVFLHPMTYALFLGLACVFVYNCIYKVNKYVLIFLGFIIVISAFTCGVRSVLGGILVVIIYYLLMVRNFKLIFLFVFISIIGYYVISMSHDLYSYVGSIFDFDNKDADVRGSSLEMRLDQFMGALQVIENCPWFGKGYGWTGFYIQIHGAHPRCLYFESLVYVVMCNFGVAGFLIWGNLVFQLLKNKYRIAANNRIMLNSLVLFYLSYSCITGEYGYMRFFLLFYILMLKESLPNKEICRIR